ncbi:MAG: hypothetical protein V3R99_00630 [Thermoguttaceae bacterium]
MLSDTSFGYTEIHFALPPQATFTSSEPAGPACPVTRETLGRANPHLSPEEVELKFVELQYGRQQAKQVRETMMRRRATSPEPRCHVDHYYG